MLAGNACCLGCLAPVAIDSGVGVFASGVDVVDDIGASMICLRFAIALGGLDVVMHRILDVAIDFFGGTFHLVDDAIISELLISDGFANSLLDFSFHLIELPTYLLGIHE
jgi:hypothetical protein